MLNTVRHACQSVEQFANLTAIPFFVVTVTRPWNLSDAETREGGRVRIDDVDFIAMDLNIVVTV